MSTPAEQKFVTFLRKLQSGGLDSNPLSFIKKIYSDRPRQDICGDDTRGNQFPRIQVSELGGVSKFSGIGATDRIYEVTLECIVYVDMDSPLDYTDAKISAFWSQSNNLSPEEACGAIAYHIADKIGDNKATLHSDNSHTFILRGNASYTNMGVDNVYFENLNVYKGSVGFNFYLRA